MHGWMYALMDGQMKRMTSSDQWLVLLFSHPSGRCIDQQEGKAGEDL